MFAEFTPILPKNREEVLNYYKENNLDLPNNTYFSNYFKEDNVNTPDLDNQIKYKWDFSRPSPTLNTSPEEDNFNWQFSPDILNRPKTQIPMANFPDNEITREIKSMSIDDNDKNYLMRLAQKESAFRPFVTNQLGYYGLYQFGKLAFKDVGFDKESFQDTLNQHAAALKLAQLNERRLKDIIENFEGQTVNGITVTRNGIRAAAHLLGAATVRDYFQGTRNTKLAQQGFKDANGTTIEKYLRDFSA